jgi:hypothetical protein
MYYSNSNTSNQICWYSVQYGGMSPLNAFSPQPTRQKD